MTKKIRERKILKMIYDEDRFEYVRESESPDFRLRCPNEKADFDVEVTEFYYSESDARITNIPTYLSELFGGSEHRHKDDVDSLKVEKMTLVRSGGTREETIDGIMRKLPETSEYVQMIATVISKKDKKLVGYSPNLSHVNLIILDHGKRLITTSPDYFYKLFFNRELQDVLAQTGFREIFFVTLLKSDKRVYVPLKLLFLLSEFYLFYWARHEHEPDKEYESLRAELALFIEFMHRRGISIALTGNGGNGIELLWSNYGILLDDSHVTIKDYADYSLPRNVKPSDQCNYRLPLEPSFLEYLKEFTDRNTFVANVASEVLQDAQL